MDLYRYDGYETRLPDGYTYATLNKKADEASVASALPNSTEKKHSVATSHSVQINGGSLGAPLADWQQKIAAAAGEVSAPKKKPIPGARLKKQMLRGEI